MSALPPPTPIYVDSDNALGARWGDVDDGFAVAALLASDVKISAIAAVGGNCSAKKALRNLRTLADQFATPCPILQGARPKERGETEASRFLLNAQNPLRVLALGPLTNVAAALRAGHPKISNLSIVGSDRTSKGRFPPWWPMEFNLTKDLPAFRTVFDSQIPITIAPLDVCRRMQVRWKDLEQIPDSLGAYLRQHARRWWIRARILKLSASAPLWDLIPVLHALDPKLFRTGVCTARLHRNGWLQYGVGTRQLEVIQDFSPGACWGRALTLFSGAATL